MCIDILKAHWFRQVLEEIYAVPLPKLHTLKPLRIVHPYFMELVEICRECLYRVVLCDIIFFELLDYNQYEQVEHYMGDDHYEADVVDWGV